MADDKKNQITRKIDHLKNKLNEEKSKYEVYILKKNRVFVYGKF